MTASPTSRLAAEALGTCLLVATVVGSGIMAERLAGGNAAVALLGNTLATSAMLFVLIEIFGPVSGAHFNPAVTLVFFIRREIGAALAALYVAVQFLAAASGTVLAHLMFEVPLLEASQHARAGFGQSAGEFVATFALVMAILGALAKAPSRLASIVALTIAGGYWFTSSTSFANPAVALARSLTDSFSGIRIADVPAFVAAEIAGALCAALLARWLFTEATSGDKLQAAAALDRAAGSRE